MVAMPLPETEGRRSPDHPTDVVVEPRVCSSPVSSRDLNRDSTRSRSASLLRLVVLLAVTSLAVAFAVGGVFLLITQRLAAAGR